MEDRYIIIMYRWGIKENHSYCIGMAKSYIEASIAGKLHGLHRGNKYSEKIIVEKINKKTYEFDKIVSFSDEEEENREYEYVYSQKLLDSLLQDLTDFKYVQVENLEYIKWTIDDIIDLNYHYSYFNEKEQSLIRDISEQYIRDGKI